MLKFTQLYIVCVDTMYIAVWIKPAPKPNPLLNSPTCLFSNSAAHMHGSSILHEAGIRVSDLIMSLS